MPAASPRPAAEPAAPVYARGFGRKAEVRDAIAFDYHSGFVEFLRAQGGEFSRNGLTLRLARDFGFCYGVDRTIQYAYETRRQFPGRTIYITGEIIHNPHVNRRLAEMNMRFLSGSLAAGATFEDLKPGDIVIIPAFGATVSQIEQLRRRGCVLVDTTCGSVMNVWKNVRRYALEGVTSAIHGKWDHEETRATCSQVLAFPGAHYVVIRDMDECAVVCDAIRGRIGPQEFLRRLGHAVSPGFDPQRHLQKIGLANQTTMLSSESLAIGEALRRALADRYGEEHLPEHYRAFDTICSATQDRQDAIRRLIEDPLDLVIVVGGFNSSNTAHLAEIAARRAPAYHVEGAEDLISRDRIRHRDLHSGRIVETNGWLKPLPLVVGFTSGASTPNAHLGRTMLRLCELCGVDISDLELPAPNAPEGPLPIMGPDATP